MQRKSSLAFDEKSHSPSASSTTTGTMSSPRFFTHPFTRQAHTQTQIDKWLTLHRASYISHAIANVNLKKVIASGAIQSAEAIFRKDFSVNIEESNALNWGWDKNNNHRTRVEITIPPVIVQELKAYATQTPRYFRIQTFISFSDATRHNYTSWDDVLPFMTSNAFVPLKFRDKKLSPLEDHSRAVGIHGINWPNKGDTYEYFKYICAFCNRYPKLITSGRTAIILDSFSNNSIDLQLTKVWKSFKNIAPTSSPKELLNALQGWRNDKLFTLVSKIYPIICAHYQGIRWEYGDVVVLRGNPKDVLSEYSRDEIISENKPNEVQLLWPFENNGKFFEWDLAQQDSLILGPKVILSQYEEIFSKQNIRSFYLEDLSAEQMDFFRVPKRLRIDSQIDCEFKVSSATCG